MSARIVNSVGVWPFPAVTNARNAGERDWFEINEEHHYYFLEVLPPIYFPGGFFVSEAAAHDRRGVPIYSGHIEAQGRFYFREFPNTPADIRAAKADLVEALRAQEMQVPA